MVKFILLGSGRSGSSLITESLGEHPEVHTGGELFHCEEESRRFAFRLLNCSHPSKSDSHYYHSGSDAKRFLDEEVYRQCSDANVKAIGFKMFYVHARRDANEKEAWNYLLSNKDIRVIHLYRANLLESYISLRVAFITGEWERAKGSTAPRVEVPKLELKPGACEAHFNQELAWRQWAREKFRSHPFLEIEYEKDVSSDFQSVMDKIHDFLNVSRRPARQLLEKQSRKSPREATTNFDELKDYFRHTLYEELFV